MIEQTLSYKKMTPVQKSIVGKSSSKKTISYHLQLLQNVGIDRWQELNVNLSIHWKNIVLELNKNKK